MHCLSLVALFACLLVGQALPTPEKTPETPEKSPETTETKSSEPSNLEEKSPISPATENDSDDLLRQKKSSTTTFCVEIKPGAAEPCVTICDPKPEPYPHSALIPEYILPPLSWKPPPPPTYLIKEPSCPCGLTPPALITIPHGVSLSSLNLKPFAGRSSDSDPTMDWMLKDSTNMLDYIGDTRTFPESLATTSQLNMFAEPARSGINGPMNGMSASVNLNRGQTQLTTCTSNPVPLMQRDYPMSGGNVQGYPTDRRLYQYKTMDGVQGLTMDPSGGMMQPSNMQYRQSWGSPGSDQTQSMMSNEYGRNSLGQGRLAANRNQGYQLPQQQQMMTPSMYAASRQMPSTVYGGNGYAAAQQMNQAMYANDQPAVAQQMQRAVYSGDQPAMAQQMQRGVYSGEQAAVAQQMQQRVYSGDRAAVDQQMQRGVYSGDQAAVAPQMQRAVYSGDQAAADQQMQRGVYRGDQASAARQATRQMTPAMHSGSQQAAEQQMQPASNQQTVDRGQTQQIAGSTDGSAMIQRGTQQKIESQQRDVGGSGYQENAESSSKQLYRNYAGDRQPDRITATDQKMPTQIDGMTRSERLMRRMKASVAGQNGSDQPFMAPATQVPQEKQNPDCGQQPVKEPMKA